MYSTNNEGKSVVAERFIRTLKNKIYKYMIAISKNVYIDKLDDFVKEYNNKHHASIKMKPVDVMDNTSQWTHLRRFAIESTAKLHVESSWKLHRF